MLTRTRRHRRVVRCALGAVVNVFSNRSVFTRARLLRGGPPLPTPKELECQEARQNAPPTAACANSWYAATRLRGGAFLDAGGKVKRPPSPGLVPAISIRWQMLHCRGRARTSPGDDRLRRQPGSMLFGFPDMILSVKLKPEAGDKFKLRFEEVDVLLLIAHQFFEQIPGHVILGAMAITRRLLIKGARGHLSRKIAIQYLFDGLPDMQRIEHLHVGKAIEENDAMNELVGVFHILDGLLAPYLGKGLVAPVLEQAIVQPILIDGGKLVTQRLVEVFDYGCVSAH